MSWRLMFQLIGENEPSGNSLRFEGHQECLMYGEDLKANWTQLWSLTATEVDDLVNARFEDGILYGQDGKEI